MAKVGLKDTLALLAKGYSKKEIDALAAVDDENEANPAPDPVPETPPPAPEPEAPAEPEPDYKTMYEEQLKKTKEAEDKLKKVQKENVNSNSAPDVEKAKQQQSEDLLKLVSSFM